MPHGLKYPTGRAAAPSGVMKRPPVAALFRSLGSSTQQAFCRSVYTPALLATIVLGGVGIHAAHGNSPGMRQDSVSRRGCLAERYKPVSGGSGEMIQAPRFRVRRGPFCQGLRGPICPRPSTPANSVRPLAVSGRMCYTKAVSRPTRACCFFVLWCPNGAQLYKTMLLQLMPSYSLYLRKRPFHAGLRPLPMKRFAAL